MKIIAEAEQNWKNVLWSPDGNLLLASNDDNTLSLYSHDTAELVSNISASGTINDFCWFPWMNSTVSGSTCYLTAIHDQPLKIIDGLTGITRACYKPMDHLDELDGCLSCCFSPLGTALYGGSRERIYSFDVHRPGLADRVIQTKASRSSRDGLSGLISSLTCRWDETGILAAGTFSGKIGIFDMRQAEPLILLLDGLPAGITQLAFDQNGMDLYSGHRHWDSVAVWDLRVGEKAAWSIPRESKCNQRLYVSLSGSDMISGVSDKPGSIMKYNLESCRKGEDSSGAEMTGVHKDIVSAVSCNPVRPDLIASCSGQRNSETSDNSIKTWTLT